MLSNEPRYQGLEVYTLPLIVFISTIDLLFVMFIAGPS